MLIYRSILNSLGGWTRVGFNVSIDGVERTVDVKTSQREPYVLPVKEGRVNSDYYVLGSGESPQGVGLYLHRGTVNKSNRFASRDSVEIEARIIQEQCIEPPDIELEVAGVQRFIRAMSSDIWAILR